MFLDASIQIQSRNTQVLGILESDAVFTMEVVVAADRNDASRLRKGSSFSGGATQ